MNMSTTERLAGLLQGSLASGQWSIALGAALVGGLLTSLTPCVYPIIPITLRYFGGMQRVGRLHVMARASAYVSGMILLYATLGMVFASTKMVFGSTLASPWVVGLVAVFCFAMGLSMLGLFTLQLPSGLNTRLSQVGKNGVGGAFLMGLVSGFIAAPCTGPVLAVILTLVAAVGATSLGFFLMVAFGFGLGLPFLALALFSGALTHLPAGTRWMEGVKITLATAMFVVGVYFLDIALPAVGNVLAALSVGGRTVIPMIVLGVVAGLSYLLRPNGLGAKVFEILGVVLLTVGVGTALVGAGAAASGAGAERDGSTIAWQSGYDAGIAMAKAEHRPVMIDFGADWCEACKDLERKTYVDARVQAAAQRFVAIKLDATTIDDALQKILDRYSVVGLPTVIFIDSKGELLSDPRVTGFVEAKRFVELMERVH